MLLGLIYYYKAKIIFITKSFSKKMLLKLKKIKVIFYFFFKKIYNKRIPYTMKDIYKICFKFDHDNICHKYRSFVFNNIKNLILEIFYIQCQIFFIFTFLTYAVFSFRFYTCF
jgi:hypothetical protein